MQPTPPGEREPSIPPAIEKLILRMMAKRPEDRPASAGEVKRELGRIKRALTNAETVVAELSSIRGIDETLPPGALMASPAGPTPVSMPRPPEPTETKPSLRAVIVNPPARFETTEQQLQPVVVSETPPQRAPLEPRPATDRMMLAVAPSRRWLLPVAIIGALLIVAAVWLVFFREGGEPSVVPLPPPVVVKEPPRAVPADGVTTVATPAAPLVKTNAEAQTPAVKADPPRAPKPVPVAAKPRAQHSKAEVRKRIAGLRERVKELPESQQHTAKQGLDAFETGLNPESSNPDEIWSSLDNFAKTMFK
jgi:serine/threonine-protein kinase